MLFVIIAALVLVVIFAVQNAAMVQIGFLVWSFQLNLALVVLGSLCIGMLVGAAWTWVRGLGLKRRVHDLEKNLAEETARVRRLEGELEKMRAYEREREQESVGKQQG